MNTFFGICIIILWIGAFGIFAGYMNGDYANENIKIIFKTIIFDFFTTIIISLVSLLLCATILALLSIPLIGLYIATK